MGYEIYRVGKRWAGYGVPAICEHPGCEEKIDRGFSFACGGEPNSERGCDRYFCLKHLYYHTFNVNGERQTTTVCKRCHTYKPPFPYKPETKEWAKHLLTDPSWKEWRNNHKEEVFHLTTVVK